MSFAKTIAPALIATLPAASQAFAETTAIMTTSISKKHAASTHTEVFPTPDEATCIEVARGSADGSYEMIVTTTCLTGQIAKSFYCARPVEKVDEDYKLKDGERYAYVKEYVSMPARCTLTGQTPS